MAVSKAGSDPCAMVKTFVWAIHVSLGKTFAWVDQHSFPLNQNQEGTLVKARPHMLVTQEPICNVFANFLKRLLKTANAFIPPSNGKDQRASPFRRKQQRTKDFEASLGHTCLANGPNSSNATYNYNHITGSTSGI